MRLKSIVLGWALAMPMTVQADDMTEMCKYYGAVAVTASQARDEGVPFGRFFKDRIKHTDEHKIITWMYLAVSAGYERETLGEREFMLESVLSCLGMFNKGKGL